MYKLAMPISMGTVTDESLPIYAEWARKCGSTRIFLCGMGPVYTDTSRIYTEYDKIKSALEYLRSQGLEVGIWVQTLGNGHLLGTAGRTGKKRDFVQITGIDGEASDAHSNCPLDQSFVCATKEGMKVVASLHPDLIMIDDDLRFSGRIGVRFPCFCKLHLEEYYKRIGEKIPREKLEELILTGGKNKYRSELLRLFADSMLGFARSLREAVDEVDPSIRLGQCTYETWDMLGTDPIEISKALAGGTKPFARISGPPFHDVNVVPIIEYSRLQYSWGKGSGVELFSEGDVYPRSRSHVPSRPLEVFELMMSADGTSDGMLAYMFDYHASVDYETKYVERYFRNTHTRVELCKIFNGKSAIGVEVVAEAHKAENWELSDKLEPKALEMLLAAVKPASVELLSANSIPTAYGQSGEYPLLVMGENARRLDLDRLASGAIIDISAARILEKRGVDTGLISAVIEEFETEYFPGYGGSAAIFGPRNKREIFCRIECSERAEVRSSFTPSGTPASYRYENDNGQKFLVLAYDYDASLRKGKVKCSTNNYYRKAELFDAIEWMCGKRLPKVVNKAPNLYTLASKGDGALSVALANVSLDDVFEPQIRLDTDYSEIRFVNCSGHLKGDTVYLTDIPAYGVCAFEVK